MKKFLLLGAAALMACAVNAQTLTTVWKTATPTGVRTTTGYGDKTYVAYAVNNDPEVGYIEELDATGNKVATYDVNAFLKSIERLKQEEVDVVVKNEAGDSIGVTKELQWSGLMMWTSVMTDDADNLLVSIGTAGSSLSCKTFVYIPAADRTKMQLLEIAEWPSEDVTEGRYDVPSRIVGNIAGDGAYLYITPANSAVMPVMYIGLNDDGVIYSDVELSWALPVTTAFNSSSNAATLSTFAELSNAVEEGEFAAKTYTYTRQTVPQAWDAAAGCFAASTVISQGGNCAGMDVFSIAGVDYIAIKKDDLSKRGASFEIKNLATGESVASWNAESSAGHYVGSMQARVSADGKTANIFVCAQADFIGVVKFDPQAESAIESIAADVNAPVEYYNLQGVKVANAENGLFIKKQGGKATKVVL